MKKINTNWIGLGLVAIAFVFSAIRFIQINLEVADSEQDDGKKIVRFLHWQLEPGYREAMDQVIEKYHQLPHVKDAKVEIRQMTIPDKVYSQFINVHLISGTAPDLFAMGWRSIGAGSNIASYIEPLGEMVALPNPYNTEESVSKDLPAETRELLINGAWRDTFLDGLEGNFQSVLKNYYSVPVSSYGTIRLYYNLTLVMEAKALILDGLSSSEIPSWLEFCRLGTDPETGEQKGFLEFTSDFRQWLENDELPKTLGQFLTMCEAISEIAKTQNRQGLYPIAASNYSDIQWLNNYLFTFTAGYSKTLDWDYNDDVDYYETFIGWGKGDWSFEDDRMHAYYDCIKMITRQFPVGFQGLDREQANRRFVLGHAGVLVTGGWDAQSIFQGAQDKTNPADRFEVAIARFPVPAPGERWHEYSSGRPGEDSRLSAFGPSVNRNTPNREWAIDFLQYVTSQPVNEFLNQKAGWVPTVVGAEPIEHMRPFLPDTEGDNVNQRLNLLDHLYHYVFSVYFDEVWSYARGLISYDDFVENINTAFANPRMGYQRLLHDRWINLRDRHRALERMVGVEEARYLLNNDEDAGMRYNIILRDSATQYNANIIRRLWRMHMPETEFYSE